MYLQTLASTGGDLSRTAKLLGVGEDEVRQELHSLLNGVAADKGSGSPPSMSAPPVAAPKSPLSTAKKTPAKKR
jgi:hypothetical protein